MLYRVSWKLTRYVRLSCSGNVRLHRIFKSARRKRQNTNIPVTRRQTYILLFPSDSSKRIVSSREQIDKDT